MKFKPMGERLLVKAIEADEVTAGGIVLPSNTQKTPTNRAFVVAISDKLTGDDNHLGFSVGDIIVHSRFAGNDIKLDDEEHLVLDLKDVLGVEL